MYGTSEFFKPMRIARAIRGVLTWYVRLVILGQQKRRAKAFQRRAKTGKADVETATPTSG
jgi:hypothetical protein